MNNKCTRQVGRSVIGFVVCVPIERGSGGIEREAKAERRYRARGKKRTKAAPERGQSSKSASSRAGYPGVARLVAVSAHYRPLLPPPANGLVYKLSIDLWRTVLCSWLRLQTIADYSPRSIAHSIIQSFGHLNNFQLTN